MRGQKIKWLKGSALCLRGGEGGWGGAADIITCGPRRPAEGSANSRSGQQPRRRLSEGAAPTQLEFLTFLAAFQRRRSQKYWSERKKKTSEWDRVPANLRPEDLVGVNRSPGRVL